MSADVPATSAAGADAAARTTMSADVSARGTAPAVGSPRIALLGDPLAATCDGDACAFPS